MVVAVRESVLWLQGPRMWLLREGEVREKLFSVPLEAEGWVGGEQSCSPSRYKWLRYRMGSLKHSREKEEVQGRV